MTSDSRIKLVRWARVGGTGTSEKRWTRALAPACNLTTFTRTRLLWYTKELFFAFGNNFLYFCLYWEKRDAFYSSPLLPRTAVEVVSWSSFLPERPFSIGKGHRNIWCWKGHSGDFLKSVFIHHRRILLIMSRMRHSYTVTVPEEPPATAFPLLKQDMRRKNSTMSGSMLVSTFVGLLINHAKVWIHAS